MNKKFLIKIMFLSHLIIISPCMAILIWTKLNPATTEEVIITGFVIMLIMLYLLTELYVLLTENYKKAF